MSNEDLLHYGTPRHSGRYPYGSGDEPFQGSKFLRQLDELRGQGLKDPEIAEKLGMNTSQLRTNITWANKARKAHIQEKIIKLKEEGLSDREVGKRTGVSESSVRNYVKNYKDPVQVHRAKQWENTHDALAEGVEKNTYLDVGIGVEHQIGVPRTRFDAVIKKMAEEEGYYLHNIYVRRLGYKDKPTTLKVLTKEENVKEVVMNSDKIRPLEAWSNDGGETINNINPPVGVDPKRVKIRYAEEGGESKDGVIELRPGVEDLDMGSSRYAQVRIKVGDDRFLKGMAVYGNKKDFPDGVDLIFNTNKKVGTDPRDVLKKTDEERALGKYGDNIFGGSILRQNASNVLNIVNEEGTWDTWSKDLSSQFLSKQPTKLIKERLDITHKALKDDFDELLTLTNPVVKQFLINKYSDSLNTKAAKLGAKGIPGTKSHVILPFPDMNPDEVYAPHYKDGDRVVLVRHPHGGTFEIPEVIVNNRNPKAKEMLGNAVDAIGIHPSVAKKLSGADFDGDTVTVIPNPNRSIKTSRTLLGLKDFDPMDYKMPPDPNKKKAVTPEEIAAERKEKARREKVKETQMGLASNLITDMTIKGAVPSELARAVKHSMVVIDSVKHNLDYKKSEEDNGIKALKERYQRHINPDTGKSSVGASTLISRSKKLVKEYGLDYDPEKYSSGTKQEDLYVGYVKQLQALRNTATKISEAIKLPKADPAAAKIYAKEVEVLNKKVKDAQLNAPRERQAQLLSNKLYYSNLTPGMSKDQLKKLRQRSLARARVTVGARGHESIIDLTDREWAAIQANAISSTKLKEVLKYADLEKVRKLASPRQPKMTTAKAQRAKSMLDRGKTYSEVAEALGVSTSTIRAEVEGTYEKPK